MQRAPVFVFLRTPWRRASSASGSASTSRKSVQPPRRPPCSGKLTYIGQYQVGLLLRYLRVQLHDGRRRRSEHDGQGDVRRVRMDPSELPSRRQHALQAQLIPQKHSHINMLLTRGKRVVAEAVINNDVLKWLMGVDTEALYEYRQIHMVGGFLAGSASNSAIRRQRPHGDVHRHRPGRRQHRGTRSHARRLRTRGCSATATTTGRSR